MRFVKGYRGADGSIQNQIGRYGQVGRFTGHGGAQLRGYPDYVIGGFHDDPRDEPGIDRLPPEYRGEPIIFSANTSVQSSTSGQAINTDALRNNLNRVVEIHEIKFACIAKEGTIAGGGIIGVKLTYKEDEGVQPHPITRDFMPLSLLSGNDYTENPASFESNIVFPTPAGYAGYSIYKLSLRYPIRLPPGALIEPLFSHLGQTPNAITVYVSYAGRVLPRGEDVKGPIYLPYFTQFATTI